jgi:predicted dienelactone hydrolase
MDHYFANSYNLSFEYVASKIWERPSTHITHLLNHENWRKYIDGTKIGVAGHSQGGMTALWVGGAKINAQKFLTYQRGRRNDPVKIIPGRVEHETFLNECDEEGKAEFPEACVDDPSVDRAKVHKLIAGEALNFFDTHLKGL